MDVVKPALIKANAEMPTHCKQAIGRAAVETERAGTRQGDATVRAYGNTNRKSPAEMTGPDCQSVTTLYATIFTGAQAIAKAFSTAEGNGATPRVIVSPVIDKLRRFQPLAWYFLGGYARFREASLRRLESSSSIGTNA